MTSPAPSDGYVLGGARIAGVVSTLPPIRVENSRFVERFGEAAVADVVKMIGVQSRYKGLPGQTTSDLCEIASRRLMDQLGWEPESVDALILITQTPDCLTPSTACILQAKLGLSTRVQAFDVNLGCSGYTYGLWLSFAMVHAGLRRVLLLAGDSGTDLADERDRSTALLFGCAGSATAIEADPDAPPAAFVLGTDGTGARNLIVQGGGSRPPVPDPRQGEDADYNKLFMDGGEVFSFTLKAVPGLIARTLSLADRTIGEIDAVLLHQASKFMITHLGKKIGVTPDRLPINIDRYGNTASATLPLLLTDDMGPRLRERGGRLILAGFGIGWSWGAVCLDMAPLGCAETIFL